MLTRIEIDGFKTFRQFSLDLRPFVVIAGANASGKSNLFDAIQFLARLADGDLRSAALSLRGQADELFHRSPDGSTARRIDLAAEVLIEPRIRDPWGQEQDLIHTRLRYEVALERRLDANGLERLFVVHEAAKPIRASDDAWAQPYKRARAPFVKAFLRYKRQADLLETSRTGDAPAFKIHQDGTAGRERPAVAAEATVLSSITTAEFRHLYALREEMRSWRFLQLDPAALRRPVDHHAPDKLEPSGWNLAKVLARIRAETATDDDPDGLLTDIAADMAHLIPGLRSLTVHNDEARREWELRISTQFGPRYTGRVASDGTLRLLALITALSDPDQGGVICFEEPENGIHPARIRPLVDLLRQLVTDPMAMELPESSRLLQLIVTTHSPVVVGTLRSGEGVFFESTSVVSGAETASDVVTRAREVQLEIQGTLDPDEVGHLVTKGEVATYLDTVAGP